MIAAIIILSALNVVLLVLAAPTILMLLLRRALLCVDGGSREWDHVAAAVVAGAADVVAAHTTWPVLAGRPKAGEWTISHTLRRLCQDFQHPDYLLFVAMVRSINRASPTRMHIEVPP